MNIHNMTKNELTELIAQEFKNPTQALTAQADAVRREHYGDSVYFRGLIEITNYCGKNCYYCGIRAANKNIVRYRLSKDDILACCANGYALGFRTFVLQGGEDAFFTDDVLVDIVGAVRKKYPDCAITLSLGERDAESYKRLFASGANRYLLRHETANDSHYARLHPNGTALLTRIGCLRQLKAIGFQVGAGFMVGSPFQTVENLAEDLLFLKELQPHMVGIGPFIPQKDTPFGAEKAGELAHVLTMISLTRLMLPEALLPSTTALGTIAQNGRELGIRAGANVVMPNLSPVNYRKNYALYDNKPTAGEETAEGLQRLIARVKAIGYTPDFSRGNHVSFV